MPRAPREVRGRPASLTRVRREAAPFDWPPCGEAIGQTPATAGSGTGNNPKSDAALTLRRTRSGAICGSAPAAGAMVAQPLAQRGAVDVQGTREVRGLVVEARQQLGQHAAF